MSKVGRLESFIGDKIKSKVTVDHLPPVMDRCLIAKAKREAEEYLKRKPKTEVSKKK